MWRATTVLLIDDSELFQFEVSRLIERGAGGAVEVVGAAKSGRVGVLEAQRLAPQVILLDLNMPGLHGLEAISLLREVSDARIIVVSVWDDEEKRRQALEAGADDFVGKASITTDLLPAIERVLKN